MANKILDQAQNYVNLGWYVFPITPAKKEPPLVKWRSESSNDPNQIKRWWVKWPDANIGLDCGKSGLVVIDVDKRNSGLSNWQAICEEHDIDTSTLQTITPSGGRHIFYKAPESVKITNFSPWKHLGIDIRGDGGYVLLPPSTIEDGDYKFHVEEINEPIPRAAPLPDILAELLNQKDQEITEAHNENDIIEEGDRDDTLTSLAGTMRSKGMTPEAIEAALLAENRNRCRIPLNDRQVKKIAASVSKYPPGKPKSKNKKGNETQAAKLIEFGCELILFHDENKEAMVFIDGEVVHLKSKKIKQWLSRKFYHSESKSPNTDSLTQALLTLEGKAIFDGPEHSLHNRIADHEGAFWYDLGDGQAVKIIPGNWQIVEAPILFKRYSHHKPQVQPLPGGNSHAIFDFLNVPESERTLMLVTIISYFIPEIAHPIIHPHGPHGSGKTSFFKIIKRLCDPSNIEVIITPKNQSELVQVISHHHFCPFDNLSDIPSWMSDILCQACTGGGFSKRQLFTDDDDIIYQLKRCIGLNGINLLISKPDLLDRSILIYLDRIDPKSRLEESDIWSRFERAKPSILGGILDVLSKAMSIYPNVTLPLLPRMADFARWGYAVAEALGDGGNRFLNAYNRNISRQNEEVIQYNSLAQAVLMLMDDKENWGGNLKKAHEELFSKVTPDKKDPTFPKSPRTLRKHLERIKANLIDYGITYEIGERCRDGYPITFQKDCKFGAFASPSTQPLSDNELACEPSVNESEANKGATLFTSRAKSLPGNICEPNVPNASNFGSFREILIGRDEDFDERAGIMEFDGGLSREEAEFAAMVLAGEPT